MHSTKRDDKIKITGKVLEKARIKAGFETQVSAARFLGVSDTTYRRWVSGKYTASYTAWLALSLKKQNLDLQSSLKNC